MDELFLELIDALSMPAHDHSERSEHIRSIEQALLSAGHDRAGVLQAARSRLLSDAASSIWDLCRPDPTRDDLIRTLKAQAGGEGFLYHGTVFGRLERISEHGLDPSAPQVWREQDIDRRDTKPAVFFDETWRGAAGWAEVASRRSRGPKTSKKRQPVVLRFDRLSLKAERDPFATKRGCFMVEGSVRASDAEVFCGPLTGYPVWRSLLDIVAS